VQARALEPGRPAASTAAPAPAKPPNVVLVFGDQWRVQATGYAGVDPCVRTPHLDALARRSVNFENAVSGCPVCCPMRASMLTGQSPVTHGVFVNDVQLRDDGQSLAQVFGAHGYDTGYIGKWHVDGRGRSSYIPPECRQGFGYWKVLECTHNYNESYYMYYAGDSDERLTWEGYDAAGAQTADALRYLRGRAVGADPFMLVLSWGPPHNPYGTAPQKYRDMYDPSEVVLRPNVTPEAAVQAREDLAGYYAHCTALDDQLGELCATLDSTGLAEDTLLVFFSDHGDMLGSHGMQRKQKPYDEACRVPCLISHPRQLGAAGGVGARRPHRHRPRPHADRAGPLRPARAARGAGSE
jgi:arylsulfatase A-like enzyme